MADRTTSTATADDPFASAQLDEFGRVVDRPRNSGETNAAYAERLVERIVEVITEAELRIIDLEQMRDVASAYGPTNDE